LWNVNCSKGILQQAFEALTFKPTSVVLETYTKEVLKPLGEITVNVVYEDATYKLPLLVSESGNCPLLGRNWLCHIKLNWPLLFASIYTLSDREHSAADSAVSSQNLSDLLSKYDKLFDTSTLGCYTGEPVS